jgi:hypothetical protein
MSGEIQQKRVKNGFCPIVRAALSIRGNTFYLEERPESGYIWKPYKQKFGNEEKLNENTSTLQGKWRLRITGSAARKCREDHLSSD